MSIISREAFSHEFHEVGPFGSITRLKNTRDPSLVRQKHIYIRFGWLWTPQTFISVSTFDLALKVKVESRALRPLSCNDDREVQLICDESSLCLWRK